MINIDPRQMQLAFVRPATLMFSDAMARVAADPALSAERRRDILSGLRRVAKALGTTTSEVPADARWLQKRLAGVAPAATDAKTTFRRSGNRCGTSYSLRAMPRCSRRCLALCIS